MLNWASFQGDFEPLESGMAANWALSNKIPLIKPNVYRSHLPAEDSDLRLSISLLID